MKLIDEKGRLFGLINVIDLSVILIIITGVVFIYSGYKSVYKHQHDYVEEIYYITMMSNAVAVSVADVVKIGDKGKEGAAEVVRVKRLDIKRFIDPYQIVKKYEGSDEIINYEVVSKLLIVFKAKCHLKRGLVHLNGVARKRGKSFAFSAFNYDLTGTILDISKELKKE